MREIEKIRDQILEDGFCAPMAILTTDESQRFLSAVRNPLEHPPLDWIKGHACSSRVFYEMATNQKILDVAVAVLGNDILLWGASVISHPPQSRHPWHCDIETVGSRKSLSVWIGMESIECDSSMFVLPYSHRFGCSVQEARHRFNKSREETTNEDVEAWGREFDARCRVMRPQLCVGEALFFDGNLWHTTRNSTERTRWALLLQYATPETKIRMPDPNHLDWPFRFVSYPKPPCILISGSDEAGVNRIVPPPAGHRIDWMPHLTSRIHKLDIPFPADETKGWKPYQVFHGSTPDLSFLSCHVSVLTQGNSPHPPHTHYDEEILIMLSGEADLLLPKLQTDACSSDVDVPRKRLKPGELVYYPHDFPHTLQTVSQEPANYLMLKWSNDPTETISPLAHTHSRLFDSGNTDIKEGFQPHHVFEGATSRLRKLHCHDSTLTPGAGYDAHIDSYDVVLIILEGEVETLGERVGPYSVIFYAAGEPHGIRNPGTEIAKYVVFEFHARHESGSLKASRGLSQPFSPSERPFFRKLIDPQAYVRTYKTIAWNIRQMRKR